MKGIVLAGGSGTRLDPITRVACKQLQPVYDKPMIYYPLATLLDAGIRDVLLISTPQDTPRFEDLLGDGAAWGMRIEYAIQAEPRGIAEALIIGADFVDGGPVVLILGDNIFHGEIGLRSVVESFADGAVVFAYPVTNPQRYGVVELAADGGVVSIEEKPVAPRSNLALTGLYAYDGDAASIAASLRPSARGEVEITDVNRHYADRGALRVVPIGRGAAWLDSGTHESLLDAANFVATIERRQGLKVACLEEIALERGFVDGDTLRRHLDASPRSAYREYVERVLAERRS